MHDVKVLFENSLCEILSILQHTCRELHSASPYLGFARTVGDQTNGLYCAVWFAQLLQLLLGAGVGQARDEDLVFLQ